VTGLKAEYLRGADAVSKVAFDSKIHVIRNALGLHTTVSRVQGSRLKSKREIRVAALFREAPVEFLRMIVVHELAHLRERDHGRAFYQLCEYMEPSYHQIELDLRLYLTHLDHAGQRLWCSP
jgi:UTP pyrophosphatase